MDRFYPKNYGVISLKRALIQPVAGDWLTVTHRYKAGCPTVILPNANRGYVLFSNLED